VSDSLWFIFLSMVNVNILESKQIKIILRNKSIRIRDVRMENDSDVRKGLLAGNRRSQTADTSTSTYYDMQQPSSTTVSEVIFKRPCLRTCQSEQQLPEL